MYQYWFEKLAVSHHGCVSTAHPTGSDTAALPGRDGERDDNDDNGIQLDQIKWNRNLFGWIDYL